jgi:hypothetical protein
MSAMPPRSGRQRGIALLMVVALIAVGATFMLLRSLNAATWRTDRYRVTQEALVMAKEALVARAVADNNRPGSLPCPDTDDDGQAELFAGTQCPSNVGRLPWRTLDLPDLRDASGERLWYVLSPTHRDHPSAEPINSNTVGQLTLTGAQSAANVLAILAAPGSTLIRAGAATLQDRSCIVGTNCDASQKCTTSPSALTPKCNPVNYLDISGGVDNAGGGNTLVSAPEGATFNDRLIAVHADDVMPLVEKRAGGEFSMQLRKHYDAWQTRPILPNVSFVNFKGFYPWAAPFGDPENTMTGASPNVHGQLPLGATPLLWTSASSNLGTCIGVGTSQIECTAVITSLLGLPVFTITGEVGSGAAANGFFDPPDGTEVTVVSGALLLGTASTTWSLNAGTQALDFSYGTSIVAIGTITIQVRAPSISAWTTASWLASNMWYRVAYYALSPDYALNGSGACGSCIAVANTAPASKHAVVIMTGRSLTGQSARPVPTPASVADYMEGANQTPADLAFEQNFRDPGFNDQPVVVRPWP